MQTISIRCLRCNGFMDEGYILDRGTGWEKFKTYWIEGKPVKARFTIGVNPRGKKVSPVSAFRCSSCGYLEFYARETSVGMEGKY